MSFNGTELQVSTFMGGIIVCICFSCVVYGITLTQTYIYLLNSKDDPKWMKIWVSLLCFLETIHSIFAVHLIYYLAVTSFGDAEKLGLVDWSTEACLFTENMIVSVVDIFFIRRLWILSGQSLPLTITASLLLLGRVGCHTATTVLAISLGSWEDGRNKQAPYITVQLANSLAAVTDGFIALSLIYFLYRRRTGQQRTNGILNWLMIYTINSGAVTMIVSISVVMTWALVTDSLIAIGLAIVVCKIYVNSLLGSLNARRLFNLAETSTVEPVQEPLTAITFRASSTYAPGGISQATTSTSTLETIDSQATVSARGHSVLSAV